MNGVGVKASDGVRLEGFIEVEIINKVDNVRRTYKNTITKGGKQFLLAHSAAQMLNMSASMRGKVLVNSGLVNRWVYNDSDDIIAANYDQNWCLTNLLLNLGDLQTGLTENSTYVNLFDSTGVIDGNKVVGYANNNVSPTANGKEGSIDYCKDEYVADGTVVCERWKYPEGVATGTIDTIAMAPGGWRTGKGFGGQRFSKCIDKVNLQQATYGAKSTQFCPPGIAGFTSNDEILINYSQDSVSRHKYTISTGEITDNPTNWFVFPEDTTDIVKIGNYIYSINGASGQVNVWLASNMSSVTSFNPGTKFPSSNRYNYRLVVDGSNKLWMSCIPRDSSVTSGKRFGECVSNGTYFYTVGGTNQLYEDFSKVFTVPTGWNNYDINFGMCGQYYVAYLRQSNYGSNNYVFTAILFTNPNDILGSIVDIIPEVYETSSLFAAGTTYGVIDIGYPTMTNYFFDGDTKNRRIVNNSGSYYISSSNGCYLTLNGWYCTLLSFVKLQTPIVKQDTDIMYVSYGYKVV